MRCDTARKRYPDARSEEHIGGCDACREWLGAVERARVAAARGPAAPGGLSARVMERLREPAPLVAPPDARPARWSRWIAIAAGLATIAAALSFGLLRSGMPALAAAADATEAADTARFTLEATARVDLEVPDALREAVDALGEGLDRGFGIAGSPPAAVLPGDLKRLIRERLAGLGEGAKEIGAAIGREYLALPSLLSGGLEVALEAEGEIGAGGEVRVEGRVASDAGAGSFEAIRAGGSAYVRAGGPWHAAPGLPTSALGAVERGLGGLAGWLRAEAEHAETLGRETLEGAETIRYRLAVPGSPGSVEVWVDAEDDLVRRIVIEHALDEGVASAAVTLDFRFFGHGEPVDVEAPRGATTTRVSVLPEAAVRVLGELELWIGGDLPGP